MSSTDSNILSFSSSLTTLIPVFFAANMPLLLLPTSHDKLVEMDPTL